MLSIIQFHVWEYIRTHACCKASDAAEICHESEQEGRETGSPACRIVRASTCFSLALQLDSPDKHLNIRLSTPPFLLLPTPPLVYFMPNTAAHYSAELVGPPPLPPPPIESWICGISSLASADQGNFPAGGGQDRVSSGDAPANPVSRCDNCLALGWLQVGKRSVEKGGRSAPAIVILVPSV